MNANKLERLDHLLGLDDVSREEYHELRGLTLDLWSEYRDCVHALRGVLIQIRGTESENTGNASLARRALDRIDNNNQ